MCGDRSAHHAYRTQVKGGWPVSATGTLEIVGYGTRQTYEWNGNVADRAAARAAFDQAFVDGLTLASVVDTPGHSKQVHTFSEIEQIEKERGTVEARVFGPLVGG